MSVDELIDGAQAYLDEGYTALKLRAGVHAPATDVQRVAAVREAVGSDVTIMVDGNERLDPAGAQWLAHRFADLGVSWLEEPLPASDVAGHRALAARSPVPLAVGEHLQGPGEFVPYADPAVAGVLQPDAPLTGGISEFLRIATLAEANGLAVSPHFLPELHVHLAAACRTATRIEHFPLIDDLLGELLPVRGGRAAVPQRPGHGMVWDDHALQRYTRQRMDTAGVEMRLAIYDDLRLGRVDRLERTITPLATPADRLDSDPLGAGWWVRHCRDMANGSPALVGDDALPLDGVALHAPVLNPGKVIACASNYAARVAEMRDEVLPRTGVTGSSWLLDFDVFLKAPLAAGAMRGHGGRGSRDRGPRVGGHGSPAGRRDPHRRPPGVGPIRPGDAVDVSIGELGALSMRVIAEQVPAAHRV